MSMTMDIEINTILLEILNRMLARINVEFLLPKRGGAPRVEALMLARREREERNRREKLHLVLRVCMCACQFIHAHTDTHTLHACTCEHAHIERERLQA